MSYCPEPDSYIKVNIKVELNFTDQATKKFEHSTNIHTSDLAAKKHFILLKPEVDKLEINKLVNGPTSFNNSKANIDHLDAG